MSFRQSIDVTTDVYELNITNAETEDNLSSDDTSSASDFSLLLHPHLDLSPLLHLRAVEAELTLDSLQIGGLPLTFTRTEQSEVLLTLPEEAVKCNRKFNDPKLKESNEEPLKIKSADHICEQPSDAIAFINNTFRYRINYYIISTYLKFFFDDDILIPTINSPLTHADINLLLQYIDGMLYIRHTVHQELNKLLGLTDDISQKIKMSTTGKYMTSAKEELILSKSAFIKAKAERKPKTQRKEVWRNCEKNCRMRKEMWRRIP